MASTPRLAFGGGVETHPTQRGSGASSPASALGRHLQPSPPRSRLDPQPDQASALQRSGLLPGSPRVRASGCFCSRTTSENTADEDTRRGPSSRPCSGRVHTRPRAGVQGDSPCLVF